VWYTLAGVSSTSNNLVRYFLLLSHFCRLLDLEDDALPNICAELSEEDLCTLRLVCKQLTLLVSTSPNWCWRVYHPDQLLALCNSPFIDHTHITHLVLRQFYNDDDWAVFNDYSIFGMFSGLTALYCSGAQHLRNGCFDNLVNLTTLDCSECDQLTNGCFDNLVSLTTLECNGCDQLTNGCFDNLLKLTALNCDFCDDLTNGCFDNLVNLTTLNCTMCRQLSNGCFDKLVNLTTLDCSGCIHLTNGCFDNLVNLTTLNCICSDQLTDGCADNLVKLTTFNRVRIR